MPETANELTIDQFRAIEWHTNGMIAAAESGRQSAMRMNKLSPSPQTENQITYYRNIIAGFKWSLGIAKQRCPACRSV